MLNQRLRLMLVCIMEDMAMVLVSDMLDLDMDIPVLDMLDMEDTVLAMAISAMLVLATMARDLLTLNLRIWLWCWSRICWTRIWIFRSWICWIWRLRSWLWPSRLCWSWLLWQEIC